MVKRYCPYLLLIFCMMSCVDKKYSDPLDEILAQLPSAQKKVVLKKDVHDLQIRYTQINRDSLNRPSFQSFEFNVDENRYFYPASTVKMPIAFLAMEYINELRDSLGIVVDEYSAMHIDSLKEKQSWVDEDTTSSNGEANIAHYIKKIFTVSDNDAYNRLYEIMGRAYINEQLSNKGFDGININHRLSLFGIDNRYTPSWRIVNGESILFQQDERFDTTERPNLSNGLIKGKGYINGEGSLVKEPFDFTHKNALSIRTLENLLICVLFPEPVDPSFQLTNEQYLYLYKCMSILPDESEFPKYDLYDSYVKFIMFGDDEAPMPDHIRIFNKVGNAYGYLTDCAYVVDIKERVEFLLTVTISVNENQIYNDGQYEYDEVGYPFLAKLGQAVYQYELGRERIYKPDLSRFVVEEYK